MNYTANVVYTDKKVAKGYDAKRFTSWRGRLVDRLEKHLMVEGVVGLAGKPSGQSVLDAPAGTGRLATELVRQGFRVVAIDISSEMLKQGEEIHGLRLFPNFLGSVCCDLEHLPFRDDAFEATASLRVMGHLPPNVKELVLKEMDRVSRKGVVIMFSLDNQLLRLKLRLFTALGLRSRAAMWFPASHGQILAIGRKAGWDLVWAHDMVRWATESRAYVFRRARPASSKG